MATHSFVSFVRRAKMRIGEGAAGSMFPPRHAAGPGRRAMRMADARDRDGTPMSLALLAVCFAALSTSRALRHATKARHATLHIEFDTEQPTETTPDAGSPAHLFLYAASAYAIYNLVSSTMRDPLSWKNPPAIGGPHSREIAGKAAERRRAASQPPSQTLHHHQQTAAPSERSNGDASATTRGPMPPTTRPPPRPQCKARPPPKHKHPPRQQPRQPRMQHHHARWPPPRTAHQSPFRRKDGGTLGWSTAHRPSANARGSARVREDARRRFEENAG